MVNKSNISQITQTFGDFAEQWGSHHEALPITRDALTNGYFVQAMGNVLRLGRQMNREKVFPSMVTSMVEIGEETGELPDMLTA